METTIIHLAIISSKVFKHTVFQIKFFFLIFSSFQESFIVVTGLQKIQSEFDSWEWKYGRTPKFQITRSFPLPQHISTTGDRVEQLQVTVTVASGLVEDIVMMIPPSLMSSDTFVEDMRAMTNLKGRRFTEDALDELNTSFGLSTKSLREDNRHFVADCVRQVMASV